MWWPESLRELDVEAGEVWWPDVEAGEVWWPESLWELDVEVEEWLVLVSVQQTFQLPLPSYPFSPS